MNNYYNYQNYMEKAKQNANVMQNKQPNMANSMVQMPGNPQEKIGGLYEPYEGFIRGNMFPNLYDPYKVRTPYEIKPMNEQAEMLTCIDSLGFAMIDLNLYLDLYPDDRGMIDLYNQYRVQKEKMRKQYEQKFGPLLTDSDALNTYPWAWNNKPWPWENK